MLTFVGVSIVSTPEPKVLLEIMLISYQYMHYSTGTVCVCTIGALGLVGVAWTLMVSVYISAPSPAPVAFVSDPVAQHCSQKRDDWEESQKAPQNLSLL